MSMLITTLKLCYSTLLYPVIKYVNRKAYLLLYPNF